MEVGIQNHLIQTIFKNYPAWRIYLSPLNNGYYNGILKKKMYRILYPWNKSFNYELHNENVCHTKGFFSQTTKHADSRPLQEILSLGSILFSLFIAFITDGKIAYDLWNISLIKIKCLIRSRIVAKVTARSTKVRAKVTWNCGCARV
jgi:hypothetical protein